MFEFSVTVIVAMIVWKIISKKRPYNIGDPIHPDEFPMEHERDFEINVNDFIQKVEGE